MKKLVIFLFLLALLASTIPAYSAGTRISALPEQTTPLDADLYATVTGGTTKKITWANIVVGVKTALGISGITDSVSTTSSTTAASATAVKSAYDHGFGLQVTGTVSASGNATNFPAATVGDVYQVSTPGWLGGTIGVGEYVNIGDLLICTATTSAGTKAEVYNPPGQYWNIQKAMISTPDGYRGVEMSINTTDVAQTYGYYFKSDGMYQTINGVHYKLMTEQDIIALIYSVLGGR